MREDTKLPLKGPSLHTFTMAIKYQSKLLGANKYSNNPRTSQEEFKPILAHEKQEPTTLILIFYSSQINKQSELELYIFTV
jgi:hypothetical protein